MIARKTALRAAALLVVALGPAAATAGAQAWNYPAFQQPRVTPREYNFAVADAGDAGTTFVFQWREGVSLRDQLSLDVGLASGDAFDTQFLVGGQYAHQLATASAQVPFDFLFTAGVNGAFGDFSLLRIPVGVSLGRRFPLEGGLAITPYIHPRVALAICNDCVDNSNVNVEFDLGANFDFTPQFAMRFSLLFTGSDYVSDDTAFGLSLAWTPPSLGRR